MIQALEGRGASSACCPASIVPDESTGAGGLRADYPDTKAEKGRTSRLVEAAFGRWNSGPASQLSSRERVPCPCELTAGSAPASTE